MGLWDAWWSTIFSWCIIFSIGYGFHFVGMLRICFLQYITWRTEAICREVKSVKVGKWRSTHLHLWSNNFLLFHVHYEVMSSCVKFFSLYDFNSIITGNHWLCNNHEGWESHNTIWARLHISSYKWRSCHNWSSTSAWAWTSQSQSNVQCTTGITVTWKVLFNL